MGMFKVHNMGSTINAIVMVSVGLIIIAALLPTLFSGFSNLSAVANLPFASFFNAGGIMYLVVGLAILLIVLGILGFGKGRK